MLGHQGVEPLTGLAGLGGGLGGGGLSLGVSSEVSKAEARPRMNQDVALCYCTMLVTMIMDQTSDTVSKSPFPCFLLQVA